MEKAKIQKLYIFYFKFLYIFILNFVRCFPVITNIYFENFTYKLKQK